MRFLVLFITILLCSTTIKAQRLYSESGDIYEKSKRCVVDHAKLGVFYELKFRKDSTKLDDYTEAQTVLMVSDKHLLFSDYNRLALDSIVANKIKRTKRLVKNGCKLLKNGLFSLLR